MMDVRLFLEKDSRMSLRQQCELLDINRSSVYYKSKGENSDNLEAMKLMDAHIMQEPTAGVLTMQCMLEEQGLTMSYERVRRLMRKAAIMPIYPRRTLTKRGENEYIYPYLLRDMAITRPNEGGKLTSRIFR